MNKVQRAIKHVSVTYIFAFLQRCHLNLQLHIWMGGYLIVLLHKSYTHVNSNLGGISDCSATQVICMCEFQSRGYIWWLCHKCHMHMWTPVPGRGVYLLALPQMSYAHVNSSWGVYLMDIVWKFELILGFTLASQRSFLWKTNKVLKLTNMWSELHQKITVVTKDIKEMKKIEEIKYHTWAEVRVKMGWDHRDLCACTLYHKHMIVSHVSHQAVLTQREKRVIRSS